MCGRAGVFFYAGCEEGSCVLCGCIFSFDFFHFFFFPLFFLLCFVRLLSVFLKLLPVFNKRLDVNKMRHIFSPYIQINTKINNYIKRKQIKRENLFFIHPLATQVHTYTKPFSLCILPAAVTRRRGARCFRRRGYKFDPSTTCTNRREHLNSALTLHTFPGGW